MQSDGEIHDTAAIGAQLRASRERHGITAAQAAERLHCDLCLIEALDAGEFSALGPPVYARGHLRRYADLLGEDADPLLARWADYAPAQQAGPNLTRIAKVPRTTDPRQVKRILGFIGAAIGFALVVWWVLQGAPLPFAAQDPASTAVAAVAADAAVEPLPPSEVPEAAVEASDVTRIELAAVESAGTAPPVRGELGFRASRDCWVEIRDADNRQLYFNLVRGGEAAQQVAGKAPLRVLLGNAPGVSLTWNDRPLEIPDALRRGRVAYFLLAGDGSVDPVPAR
mgnify:CR=1 FL=1